MKEQAVLTKKITKTALANTLEISRQSLYYQRKQPLLDEEVKRQIEAVLSDHPAYGHKRIALELKLNKKRILRVMKKFGIKPYWPMPGRPGSRKISAKLPLKMRSIFTNCFVRCIPILSGSVILRTLNTQVDLSMWQPLWTCIRERLSASPFPGFTIRIW